ncbi:MAG: signal peptidase II [Candidatus Coatesbacteria bacterium RBG_13_66_14]|uniref:Lipoprotein signal peptidase n=1 Tax=Candidatus Coatesbacteria bacterium RBG_13_66_14 TaxID=1817816 RepID=A0A1F5FH19_9BACT|nr:MAG: signal peptidase II [Candidatus Coatesbacteria bacterium RBG_13_66_14]
MPWPGWKSFGETLKGRSLALWLALGALVLDQASKLIVTLTIPLRHGVIVIPGFFNLVHGQNPGVVWGFMRDVPGMSYVFMAIQAVVSLVLVAWLGLSKEINKLQLWGFGLILGGALGNLVDRIRLGGVVDFLDFKIGDFTWPTFNAADTWVVVGVGLVILSLIIAEVRSRRKKV